MFHVGLHTVSKASSAVREAQILTIMKCCHGKGPIQMRFVLKGMLIEHQFLIASFCCMTFICEEAEHEHVGMHSRTVQESHEILKEKFDTLGNTLRCFLAKGQMIRSIIALISVHKVTESVLLFPPACLAAGSAFIIIFIQT